MPRYYVGCIEQGETTDKLEWHQLGSEKVTTEQQSREIIRYYERRWLRLQTLLKCNELTLSLDLQ